MVAVLKIKEHESIEMTNLIENQISQEELVKKLMALIVLMQQIHTLLNGHTVDDISRISNQNKAMNLLAEIEYADIKNIGETLRAQIEEISHASAWQKLFGNILGSVMILAGALLAVTGNVALGLIMVTSGALSLIQSNSPEALDKAITSLVGDDPFAKLGVKLALVLFAAASGSLGGAAGALMLLGTVAMTENVGQDLVAAYIKTSSNKSDEEIQKEAKESDASWITNLVIMGITTLCSIYSAYQAAGALGAAAGGASGAAAEAAAGARGAAGAAAGAADAGEGVSLADKLYKRIIQILKVLILAGTLIGGLGSNSAEISVGAIRLELADTQSEYAKVKAQTVETQQIQEMISSNISFAQNYLKDLSKNIEKLNSEIRNILSDHTAFAKVLTKLVTNKVSN